VRTRARDTERAKKKGRVWCGVCYVYVRRCACVYVRIDLHMLMFVLTDVCVYTLICVYLYSCNSCIFTCHTYVYLLVCMYMYIYRKVYIYVRVYVKYISIFVCKYANSIRAPAGHCVYV